MKGFKSRKDFEDWAYNQFRIYGIRQPDTYSEQELIDINPAVPVDFIKQHVKNRNKVTK